MDELAEVGAHVRHGSAKMTAPNLVDELSEYRRDPDDNGVELYWDRPPEAWPRTSQGELAMFTRRLDLNGLLKEAEVAADASAVGEWPRNL